MTRTYIPPTDSMFLLADTPETKMHVAGLMQFIPPKSAGPNYLRDLLADLESAPIEPPWNLKLATPWFVRNPFQAWVTDEDFDIHYHVRRSALASPGDERELGMLISRLHSNALDFNRPPWEMHLIEGLEGGRFAMYVKIHHSLVDGVSGVKLLQRSLSTSARERNKPMFFSVPLRKPRTAIEPAPSSSAMPQLVRSAASVATSVIGSTTSVAKAIYNLQFNSDAQHSELVKGLSAPRSVLNQRTGRNRRFATQHYDMARLQALAKASGGTVNDVVIAVFGGGLRAYLNELDALPKTSLIGFLPVNIRAEDDAGGGNKVGATLAPLGTDIADPVERLEEIIASTRQAKGQMAGLSQGAILAYSGYLLAPAALQTIGAMAGIGRLMPSTFNVCISNLPGPDKPLYFRGARLESYYPVSIAAHGMALNITCLSYAGSMNVGFIGCRDALPSLQRLAVHTGLALAELEKGYGLEPPR